MFERRQWVFLTALVFLVLLSSVVGATEQVTLKYRFTEGQQFLITATSQNKSRVILNNQPFDFEENNEFQFLFRIKAVDAQGNYEADFTYKAFKTTSNGMVIYDSSEPPGENPKSPAIEGYEALLKRSFNIRFTPIGKVIEVKGFNELWDEMTAEIEGPMGDQIRENIKKRFGDDFFKEIFDQSLAVFPEYPVQPGDKWAKKAMFSKDFPQNTDVVYCLVKSQENTAWVQADAVFQSDAEGMAFNTGAVSMRLWISGTTKGTMEIDKKTGLIRNSESTSKAFGNMEVPIPEVEQVFRSPVSIEISNSMKMEEI